MTCLYRYIGTLAIYDLYIIVISFIQYVNEYKSQKPLFGNGLVLTVMVLVATAVLDTGYIWGYDNYVSEEGYSDHLYEECVKYVPENIKYTEEKTVVIWNPEDFTADCDLEMLPVQRIMGMHLRSRSVFVCTLDSFTNGYLSEEEVAELNKCSCFYTIGDFSDEAEVIRKYLKIPHKTLGKSL